MQKHKTKYKCSKIQMKQNAKMKICKWDKIQNTNFDMGNFGPGFPIEN